MTEKEIRQISDRDLAKLTALVQKETVRRSTLIPMKWYCEECGLEDGSPGYIINHLKKVHGYPQEDAACSTLPIYIE